VSPTDAQLNLLATDAQRIADAFGRAAATMSAEGAEQAQAYADALGSTLTTAREGLLLVDALNARGDWKLDADKLGQFEESAAQLLGTVGRLGALASGIPAGDIGALSGAAAAATSVAESLVALSAVPFDNLQALTGAFAAGAGGGSSSTTNNISISIVQQPGQSATALADMVIQKLNSRVGARR
jgi:hypothetical protein